MKEGDGAPAAGPPTGATGERGRPQRPVLLTARHPSSASIVTELAQRLADDAEVHIVACGVAADLLRPGLDQRATLWTPDLDRPRFVSGSDARTSAAHASWARTAPADEVAALDLLRACRAVVDEVGPQLVVRMTTSEGIGPDEIMATAAPDVPVIGVQDYYGVGFALTDGEHPIARRGVDTLLVPDAWAVQRAIARGVNAREVGWAILGTVLHWDVERRSSLAAPDRPTVAVVGGADSVGAELDLVAEVVPLVASGAVHANYRPHPRLARPDRDHLRRRCGDGAIGYAEQGEVGRWAVTAEIVLSAGSNVNLQVLSFGAIDPDPVRREAPFGGPVSCFRLADRTLRQVDKTGVPAAPAQMSTMWLDSIPPVLQPGMGSVTIRDGELGDALGQLLDPEIRGRLRREAAKQFQPGEAIDRIVDECQAALAAQQ